MSLSNKKIIKYMVNTSIIKTIYFNFHYFNLKQAIHFPVLIAKGVRLLVMKGEVNLNPDNMRFSSIRIGFKSYNFQTKSCQSVLEFLGGQITLCHDIYIGSGTFISVGKKGTMFIGNNVVIGGNSKFFCYEKIVVGANSRIAWETTFIDNDFHQTINRITNAKNTPKKAICIGENNWIGFGSTVLKGTITPNYCIVAAKSLLTKEYPFDDYCLLAGHPAKKVKEGIYRDLSSTIE